MIRRFCLLVLLLWGLGGSAYAKVDGGTLLWKFRTGGQIWSSLTQHAGTLYFGNDDRHLYALDFAARKLKWKFRTEGMIRSQPAVAGDLVFAASDDGFLYAVDRERGRERWRFDLKTKGLSRRLPSFDNPYYDFLQSAPLVHDGHVYIGSLNGTLFVVDVATGRSAWSIGTSDAIRSTPVIQGDTLYFGSWDDHLYAIDLATHKQRWRADTGGIVQSTPAIGEGRVVVGSRGAKLLAYDLKTGAEAWHHVYTDGSWIESSGTYVDGLFYVGSSDSLKVSAFAADSGKEVWHFKTGGWSWATPKLANRTLYIGAISAFPYYFEGVALKAGFYALDAGSGKPKWHFTTQSTEGFITGGVMAAPVVLDGVVYVGALDGYIYALKE